MLLSAIYQDSCHGFYHCLYLEMLPLIALLQLEDIVLICHRENSKILTNHFGDKHEEINKLKRLLSHKATSITDKLSLFS